MTPKNILKNLISPKYWYFWNPQNNVTQKFKPPKNAPSLRMYQTVSECPPPLCGPWSLCGCKLAMECQQFTILIYLTRGLLKVCSVFQRWDTGKYTYNFKDLLTCHLRVEPARIGQYHEIDFGLPGVLVYTGAWPHYLYASAACW